MPTADYLLSAVALFCRNRHTGLPTPGWWVSPSVVSAQRPEEGGNVDAGAFNFSAQQGSLYWSAATIGERNGDDAIGHIDVAAPAAPSATGSLADDPESKPAQDGQRFRVCHVPNRNRHRG